jgi:AbrB family looped-hinge helix DNA binding protein
VRITSNGQVTIPKELRERFGLLPNTEVRFEADEQGVRILKAPPTGGSRGAELIRRLSGSAQVSMTTDEIMSLTRPDLEP